jgi:ferredoxin
MARGARPGWAGRRYEGDDLSVDLEIRIDRETCMGSGNCSFWAPGVFDLDEEGIAIVLDPSAAPEDQIVKAAEGCPTQSITLWRDGKQLET